MIDEALALMTASSNACGEPREELRILRERLGKGSDPGTLFDLYVFVAPRGFLGDCPFVPAGDQPLSRQEMSARQAELVRRFDDILHPLMIRT